MRGHQQDDDGRIRRRFVTLPFAAPWIAGEPVLNDELTETLWLEPAAMTGLKTTDGLPEINGNAVAIMTRLWGGKCEKSLRMAKAPCPAPVPP